MVSLFQAFLLLLSISLHHDWKIQDLSAQLKVFGVRPGAQSPICFLGKLRSCSATFCLMNITRFFDGSSHPVVCHSHHFPHPESENYQGIHHLKSPSIGGLAQFGTHSKIILWVLNIHRNLWHHDLFFFLNISSYIIIAENRRWRIWLVVSNIFYFPFHIWDVILPIDELHHFSRWFFNHQPDHIKP